MANEKETHYPQDVVIVPAPIYEMVKEVWPLQVKLGIVTRMLTTGEFEEIMAMLEEEE
jgi:hypothetical protein